MRDVVDQVLAVEGPVEGQCDGGAEAGAGSAQDDLERVVIVELAGVATGIGGAHVRDRTRDQASGDEDGGDPPENRTHRMIPS